MAKLLRKIKTTLKPKLTEEGDSEVAGNRAMIVDLAHRQLKKYQSRQDVDQAVWCSGVRNGKNREMPWKEGIKWIMIYSCNEIICSHNKEHRSFLWTNMEMLCYVIWRKKERLRTVLTRCCRLGDKVEKCIKHPGWDVQEPDKTGCVWEGTR